ncbi:MAG: UDP-N-acetylmuramoyl-tripeptide-D-alanyl-D-alanine ligase [Candidatus Gottesmanbacteria bacterium GW2011_GWA2_47_9]|uniref:UDP-N-acetylmuramoyl-tripeptide-D-alanyl-D-alanine ligase n=1 Tax=Candidatus Gottesmanbacteria bacterium GW2011_GWA2_47_9 TaxID=1618445 RepID=A0A0G1W654_9BACT|nr:MAG: UDP-N-acetylmuramoyl-tripeptide-D-alanyl-D-alanine ligase [Candidatus Gottesmanbacteria bacterium GW2011_GWA2_47_9]
MTLHTHLAILQQAEYDWKRYWAWCKKHTGDHAEVQPRKKTAKYWLMFLLSAPLSVFLAPQTTLRIALTLVLIPETIIRGIISVLAQLKLQAFQHRGLVIIAIAGSYAKTSTKHLLAQTLSPYLSVLATPDSVTTSLGIALTILKNLKNTHRIFIVELGAYQKGDVAQLVRFVHPNYGILTPIGAEHLERFGSFENVVEAETELITTLPIPVLSHDQNITIIPEKLKTPRVSFYGFFPNSAFDISHVRVTRSGTSCTLAVNNANYDIFVPLFGKHNIVNILPSFWIAEKLGLQPWDIINTFASLQPVLHRLQPISTESGMLILDNGYNSYPDSVKESFAVLKEIPGKIKIVVTPGFVEMGEKQAMYNEMLGGQLAEVATIICVTGASNLSAIQKGLEKKKFPKRSFFTAKNENDAVRVLSTFFKADTVLLFEGGTPEIYQ